MTTAAGEQQSMAEARDALVKVLQDPAGRAALIGLLEGLGQVEQAGAAVSGASNGAGAAAAPAEPEPQDDTFAVRVGAYTKYVIDDFIKVAERMTISLRGFQLLATGEVTVKWDRIRHTALELLIVFGCAFAVYWVLRLIGRPVGDKLEQQAGQRGWLWRAGLLVFLAFADLIALLLGAVAGYAAALIRLGPLQSGLSLFETLALNAFVLTGLARLAVRITFSPAREKLRLLPMSNAHARYWSRRLGFVVSFLGYGVMLAVPVANLTISIAVGNALRVLVVLLATAIASIIVLINRTDVKNSMISYAHSLEGEIGRHALLALSRMWAPLALLYILVVFGIWITRPFEATRVVMTGTGLTMLTVLGAMLLSLMMTRAISGGIRLPQDLKETLPELEGRVNRFVPHVLQVLRVLVGFLAGAILLQVWSILDVTGWLFEGSGGGLMGRLISALVIVLICFGIWLAVMSWTDLRLKGRADSIISARERTLFQLFRNAFTVVVIVMAALLALSELGVDIGPLIAGAGVLGLAFSFGAQTLVKDIITGAFIQIENAINEGDVVTVAGITGTVERLTVRSVRMRDVNGTTHIIPFSSVDMVSNFMRDFSFHVAEIGVAYNTDIATAKAAMKTAFDRLKGLPAGGSIIGDLDMQGVIAFGDSAITLRARIKTFPGAQWATGRAYNEQLKIAFDEFGIEIPFPQVTYHVADGRPPMLTQEDQSKGSGAGSASAT
ncbi:mechanosensitive ion channel domain-containing protein [Pannonibacter phragmitetus]|nr:mechanosensitive ion channel domain-containing protein [Pannonibacter phragmitetus]